MANIMKAMKQKLLRRRTPAEREARLRKKLLNHEMNPIMDAIMSIVLMCLSPFIWVNLVFLFKLHLCV
jgi:hypothetical protein